MICAKGITSFQAFLFLLLLGFLAYSNAIFHPFVHDDVVFIQKNPSIAELNFSTIFSAGVRFDEDSTLINSYYRPLLELLYRLQYKIFHLNPYAYHLFNVLLHITNSFIVFLLMLFLFSLRRTAFCVAVFFLIHPIQSEAVACISGVSNLVFAFFLLSSFYFYLMPLNKNKNYLSLILFFFALLSKEQAVILPFLILWYELCLGQRRGRKLFQNISPYFLVLVSYFLLRKMLIGSAVGSAFGSSYELWLRILAIPGTLLMYLRVIVLPYDLHYYRSVDILQPFLLPAIIFLLVVSLIIMRIWRFPQPQKRWLLFGAGWFLITLGPMLNILPLINEYSLILTSEHFLYLPLIGVLIFLSFIGYPRVGGNDKRRELVVLLIGIIFIAVTIKQNTYWRNEIVLFKRVVKYEENFGRGHILLAKAYLADGRFQESIVENEKALHIMQEYIEKVGKSEVKNVYLGFIKGIYIDMGVAHNNLGVQYALSRNWPQAIFHFQKSRFFNPDDLNAKRNLNAAQLEKF